MAKQFFSRINVLSFDTDNGNQIGQTSNAMTAGQQNSQFVRIRASDGIKHQLLPNGSLLINLVQKTDAGQYFCSASNGIGPGLSKMVTLTVHCKRFLILII